MDRKQFARLFEERILLLDGATGTQMMKRGMPAGVCPELWAIEHPEALASVQKAYVAAGSHAVYTFTFGGSRFKLSEYGLAERTREINATLARISREAVGEGVLVAGDLAPCGRMLEPYGDAAFEDVVEGFKEQVRGLLDGGVDFFAIETMMDLQEARAALLAVRELCDLPVLVTMTYESGMHTLTGTDPLSALVTLQSLGADAVGTNCSSGPQEMVDVIRAMKPYAQVPLVAKPNAGKPRLVDGKTVFDMDADQFAGHVRALVDAGVNALGGCCGTDPGFIAKLADRTRGVKPASPASPAESLVCSARRTVRVGAGLPFTVIGERLNPTGKKALKEALLSGDMDEVFDIARDQLDAGAAILDVNAGVPGIDEVAVLQAMVQTVVQATPLPVCLDSSNPEALEAALRTYAGRAIVNSVSGEAVKLERILPLAAKYGAMVVVLPVDDAGVPETVAERIAVTERVMEQVRRHGLTERDVLVDGLMMTVASDPMAGRKTLDFLRWVSGTLKANSVLGLSNVSFGMPAREWLNASFLAMAIGAGMTTAILNPSSEVMTHVRMASDLLLGQDRDALRWIGAYAGKDGKAAGGTGSGGATGSGAANGGAAGAGGTANGGSAGAHGAANGDATSGIAGAATGGLPVVREDDAIAQAVLHGNRDSMLGLLDAALKRGRTPASIIDDSLVPAITEVGALYERKRYFLPQLIQGAEAMQRAMQVLEPMLAEADRGAPKGRVVIATVRGDIHDIGKNIVALLLKNAGFDVVDLGKDVSEHAILEAVKAHEADIVALSALMTTTMTEMPKVAEAIRRSGSDAAILVGGAVLDETYAASFGAHYTPDAYRAVRKAETLLQRNLRTGHA